ncbi:hypothetical protein ACE11G_04560 [Gordonia sp. PS3]|uniref:hypothetical protein n=1 Tax=Gordonia TaxID=2053 RepID=UPI0035C248DD
MAVPRRLSGIALTLVVAALTAAGCADRAPQAQAVPEVGWLVADHSCAPDRVRAQADAVVRSGLRDVGFRELFIDCNDEDRARIDADSGVRADLASLGLHVHPLPSAQRRTAVDAASATPSGLRTEVTRRVMRAEPLVVTGDLPAVPRGTVEMLRNPEIGELVRDRRAAPGAEVNGDPETYSRAIGERGLLVSFTNTGPVGRDMSIPIADLGLAGDDVVPAREVWSGRRIKAEDGELTIRVGAGDAALLRIG